MRKTSILFLVLAAVAGLTAPASATSILLVPDDGMVDRSTVVGYGTVLGSENVEVDGRPFTDYRFRLERALKGGTAQGDVLTVRVIGGETPDGMALQIWGAPRFRGGERALLFLNRSQDGTFRPFQVVQGHFHEAVVDGERLWMRNLAEIEIVDAKAGQEGDPAVGVARDFDRFADWIADRAAGRRRQADYRRDLAPGALADKFTYIGNVPKRWFEFDNGIQVSWLADATGQPLLDGGGFSEFQAAISAWNNDPATNIRYRYQGTTTSFRGFTNDRANVISFRDYDTDVDGGDFECVVPGNGSGTLAIGGPWFRTGDLPFPPVPIREADIVVNDGAGCWFNNNGARAAQVYAHELGHTLGLGHACGDEDAGPCNTTLKDEALMRANAHRDNRGAALNDDDREGILSLYPGGGTPTEPKPAAPSALVAVVASQTAVNLTWQDNATDETSVHVERKIGGGAYQEIKALPANATSHAVTGLTAGTTYSFRVRARNNAGTSAYSNVQTVTTQSQVAVPPAPSNLAASPLSSSEIELTWRDNANNETGFLIERSSPAGGFAQVATAPAGATRFTVPGQTANFPYTFRVRATNASGSSAFSNLANATTRGAAGSCAPSAQNLCLGGNRFRVSVWWRRPAGSSFESGTGTAVPLSSQTGLFWFFDAANIELITKVLDGTSLTGFYWTFYGGLSDVAYWVAVTDTVTGASKTYHNPQGNFCGVADTASLPEGGARSVAAPFSEPEASFLPDAADLDKAGTCVPSATALCLLDNRFKAEVNWDAAGGQSGVGTAVPIAGNNQSGLFWFFDSSNIELVVKAIDGFGLNQRYWIFYGALSDVRYTLRVTDTVTGSQKTYNNAQGNVCGQADSNAFAP